MRNAEIKQPRHVRLPIEVLNDQRLSNDAKVAFCVLLDCHFDRRSNIGLKHLAKRLGVSRASAWRCIHSLEAAGYIKNHDKRKGAPPSYEILRSLTGETSGAASSLKNGAEKSHGGNFRSLTGETISIRSLLINSLEPAIGKTEKDESLRYELLEALRRCPLNGTTAEREGDRLARRFPRSLYGLSRHLRFALNQNIEDPIEYAELKTQRGDIPGFCEVPISA